jgi:hypothetical protein
VAREIETIALGRFGDAGAAEHALTMSIATSRHDRRPDDGDTDRNGWVTNWLPML